MGRPKGLDLSSATGGHFLDPDGAVPALLDHLRNLFRPQGSFDVTAMTALVILCSERDPALTKQLVCDLPVYILLLNLDRQKEDRS